VSQFFFGLLLTIIYLLLTSFFIFVHIFLRPASRFYLSFFVINIFDRLLFFCKCNYARSLYTVSQKNVTLGIVHIFDDY